MPALSLVAFVLAGTVLALAERADGAVGGQAALRREDSRDTVLVGAEDI
jgi:hypothetical protein